MIRVRISRDGSCTRHSAGEYTPQRAAQDAVLLAAKISIRLDNVASWESIVCERLKGLIVLKSRQRT